jgi:hypothetical protein
MDCALAARQLWPLIEPIHAVVYFAEEVTDAATTIGLERSARYFALRAAPMGAVTADVVSAVFYGFSPHRVAEAISSAWEQALPQEVVQARAEGIAAALGRLLAGADTAALGRAAHLAQAAARSADDVAARALTAANRRLLEDPGPAALRLWQAATVLREHRGEGHVVALAQAQVAPVEAHVLRAATGAADLEFLRVSRGWRESDIEAAQRDLVTCGRLDRAGALTERGWVEQAAYEAATDRLAGSPWRGLGADRTEELAELLRPIALQVVTGCAEAMKVGLGSPWPPPVRQPS